MVLEINARAAQFQMERGHKLAVDMISDAAESFILHGSGQQDGNSHSFEVVDVRIFAS
jgi:hypothetical protein